MSENASRAYSEQDLNYLRAYGGMGSFHMARDLGRSRSAIQKICLKHEIPLGGWVGKKSERNKYATDEWLAFCAKPRARWV